jgi:hypothetical protein
MKNEIEKKIFQTFMLASTDMDFKWEDAVIRCVQAAWNPDSLSRIDTGVNARLRS